MVTPMRYDVIVCGAGPAGATAARILAESGRKVCLVEKQKLPRHKTCGGGMPIAIGSKLRDIAPSAFAECNVTSIRHTYRLARPVHSRINRPGESDSSLWMVQRPIFDNALTDAACAAGARLLDSHALCKLVSRDSGVEIVVRSEIGRGSETTLEADYLVAADGANGLCARLMGLRRSRDLAIAMEIELPHDYGTGHESVRRDVAHLDFGSVPNGYAWVFPKGDHLNIGAGRIFPRKSSAERDSASLKKTLVRIIHEYARLLGLPEPGPDTRYFAHPLPVWSEREPLTDDTARCLLCGDAAGLVNPFFGDGILNAVTSGEIAASAIIDGATRLYSSKVHEHFAANMEAAKRYASLFYRYPRFFYELGVRREEATRVAMRLLAGELGFDELKTRLARRIRTRVFTSSRVG